MFRISLLEAEPSIKSPAFKVSPVALNIVPPVVVTNESAPVVKVIAPLLAVLSFIPIIATLFAVVGATLLPVGVDNVRLKPSPVSGVTESDFTGTDIVTFVTEELAGTVNTPVKAS